MGVRQLPASGISRLWKHTGSIEVTAAVPEAEPRKHAVPPGEDAYVPFGDKIEMEPVQTLAARRWQMHHLAGIHGPDAGLRGRAGTPAVRRAWRKSAADAGGRMDGGAHGAGEILESGAAHDGRHGPAACFHRAGGFGQDDRAVQMDDGRRAARGQKVRVWRLDGENANVAEFLTLHCEMIGVPVERFWSEPPDAADLLFVDLPGVEPGNMQALLALRDRISALPSPHVHLVLNAAYETSLLFEQFHAFAAFAPEDVIFTHLDEEPRRVKLWNFVLGTNCSVSFLGGGQKIPGDFQRAESALLFPGEIRP